MRLFLAIEIPQKIKDKIEKKIDFLKKEYPQFRWVAKENYHLTLFFFGETEKLDLIKKKISQLIYDQESFNLITTNLDLFINRKIVVFLNFYREKKIENLAKKINKNFYYFKNSYLKNKKFVPHLTLARGKIPSKQQYFHLKKILNKTNIETSFIVNEINLFQSILSGKKPIYKKMAVFNLNQINCI